MNAEDCDRDHIPPRRFYPRELRAQSRARLLTAITHPGCNRAYQRDEDYFFAALVPIAAALGPASSARYALNDLARSLARPQGVRLQQTLAPAPSNIQQENVERILAALDHGRLDRVIWKIVRGLAYGVLLTYLPNSTEYSVQLYASSTTVDSSAVQLTALPGDTMNAFCFGHSVEGGERVWHVRFWTQLLAVVTYGGNDSQLARAGTPSAPR